LMKHATEPAVSVRVDPSNPGQFFACCGLLELADRLWPSSDVRGAFTKECFQLFADTGELSLKEIIQRFVNAQVSQLDDQDSAASPLRLGEPFNLRLDWWRKLETSDKRRVNLGGGDRLKTWAGKQLGPLIFRLMKKACADIDLEAPFDDARPVYVKDVKAKQKAISPFYFDARREETSLDRGFSPDEQDMSVVAYPAVESLALVGLQRFRPRVDESLDALVFLYTAWADPIPAIVAMAAVSGMMSLPSCGTFAFTKPSRGGEYLTMFSRATRKEQQSLRSTRRNNYV
jgi:hypothetical protein